MGSSAPASQQAAPLSGTQTQQTDTLPTFLQPYFNTLMGAAQNQLYNTDSSGNVTGMKAWQPYSTNGADYVAGLAPGQQQAINSANAMQMPGQFQQGADQTAQAGQQALGAGAQYAQQATNPNAISSYMSPYMQNVVDYQTQQANRQYDITGAQEQAGATTSGAFGGSREAIMAAENERNRNQAITGIQANGAQQAFQNAQQAQQFGANLGLQGAQTGIQAGQGLGQLGTEYLAGQQGIINTQAQQGATQQNQQQQAINAQIQNQQMAQAYPMQQLGFMSGLMRGLPMQQGVATSNYQMYPSSLSQYSSAIGSLGNVYQAYNTPAKKTGGLVGYSVGGEVEAKLYDMEPDQLKEVIQTSTSDIEKSMAKKVLAEKTMSGGGIVAFAEGEKVPEPENTELTDEEATRIYSTPREEEQHITFGSRAAAKKAAENPSAPANVRALGQQQAQESISPPEHKIVRGIVDYYANKHSVDPDLMMKSLQAESNFNPNAKSSAGASGIAQFMPATAKRFGVNDTSNVQQAIEGMAKYYRVLADRYNGDPKLIAAAYNAGEGRVDEFLDPKKQRPLPTETVNYVNKILGSGGLQDIPASSPQEEPMDIAQAAPQAPVEPSPTTQEGMDILHQQVQSDTATAAPPFSQQLAETAANRKLAGVDTNEATQQYRKELMAERANTKDEASRQFHLRMADFFAHWGSTPGPVIAAGLKSLTETMPGFLEDKKDQEKLMREFSKANYELSQADYQERMGKYTEATKLREKIGEDLKNSKMVEAAAKVKLGMHLETLQSQQDIARTYAQSREDVARFRGPGGGGHNGEMTPYRISVAKGKADIEARKDLAGDVSYGFASPEIRAKKEYEAYRKHLVRLLGEEATARELGETAAPAEQDTQASATEPLAPLAPMQAPDPTGWKVIR